MHIWGLQAMQTIGKSTRASFQHMETNFSQTPFKSFDMKQHQLKQAARHSTNTFHIICAHA